LRAISSPQAAGCAELGRVWRTAASKRFVAIRPRRVVQARRSDPDEPQVPRSLGPWAFYAGRTTTLLAFGFTIFEAISSRATASSAWSGTIRPGREKSWPPAAATADNFARLPSGSCGRGCTTTPGDATPRRSSGSGSGRPARNAGARSG